MSRMKRRCYPARTEPDLRAQKRCGQSNGIFSNVRLIKNEDWKDIRFVDNDARSSAVLIVAKTELEPFRGFFVRRWDHPYEPNFETKTYNLLEFCQQRKVRRFFETGLAGNLVVWTRDEKTGELYFIGAYEGVERMRKVEGRDRGEWKPRTALVAEAVYVLPHDKRLPLNFFEYDFRRHDFAFPTKRKISPYHSCYGFYIIKKDLAEPILGAIRRKGVRSEQYQKIGESHTNEMLERTRETEKLNVNRRTKINIDRFQKRFVTDSDMRYAKKKGIL